LSSDYDGQDQAHQDLLKENEQLYERIQLLDAYLNEIATLIHYQVHLKHQDNWLKMVIDDGIVTFDDEVSE
jgi:hypothetical protein